MASKKKTLKNILNLPAYPNGEVGLEIECEGPRVRTISTEFWRTVSEGSLRGGKEYILQRPVLHKYVGLALEDWKEATKDNIYEESIRTSVHVHLNVLQHTLTEVYNIVAAYLFLENLLVRFCGETREGNLFCLAFSEADTIIQRIMEGNKHSFFNDNGNAIFLHSMGEAKYGGLNFAALPTFGSLEFRTMRGTTNTKLIEEWVDLLWKIKQTAVKYDNPEGIFEDYLRLGPVGFAEKFLTRSVYKELSKRSDFTFLVDKNKGIAWSWCYQTEWEKGTPRRSGKSPYGSNPRRFRTIRPPSPGAVERAELLLRDVSFNTAQAVWTDDSTE